MIKDDKVSIIITTFKGSKCINRAIDSLLNQTYKNIEIIIVDDNGDETEERKNTEKVINRYLENTNIRYIKHKKNLNGAVARNTGINVATGKFIGFLDDDDYYYPTKIEKCVYELNKNNHCDAVFCDVIITDGKYLLNVVESNICDENQKKLLFNINRFGTGSNLFMTASSINSIGGFDTSYSRLQDVEFLIRFFERYNACHINEILITKSRSISDNSPDYKKLYSIKQKFYKDFNFVLNRLSSEELALYYQKEYLELLKRCFGKESKENITLAKNDLIKYRQLNFKEYISIYLSLLGSPNNNVYLILRKIASFIIKPIRSNIIKHKYKKYIDC